MTVSGGRRTILIAGGGTGGHLTPALAIAAAIEEHGDGLEPVLVGAMRGVEARILPTRDYRYHLLPSEPIYRRQWWRNMRWPLLAGRLLRGVDDLLRAERPAAVLGTGGYASAPVVWRAARGGLPTAIQEQNAYPGLATRWLSRRVRHVYLGLPEARRLLRFGRATEVFETGNPITPPTPDRREAARLEFGLDGRRPVVLVTGGSQGALALNRAVAGWLDHGGPGDADLLWVTGRATHQEFARYHGPPAVRVVDFLDPMADGYAVRVSDGEATRYRGLIAFDPPPGSPAALLLIERDRAVYYGVAYTDAGEETVEVEVNVMELTYEGGKSAAFFLSDPVHDGR